MGNRLHYVNIENGAADGGTRLRPTRLVTTRVRTPTVATIAPATEIDR
jgi:hypothetical protein